MCNNACMQMFLIFLEKEVANLLQGGQDALIWCCPFFNYCKMCGLSLKRKGLFSKKLTVENVNELFGFKKKPNLKQVFFEIE